MLTDAILKEATAEAERFRLSILPEDGEPHVFSKRFERKMQKLIRRANHPIRYQVMRTAAAVALAIVTLFGAVMAVSPEARAAVVGWIKETFGIYTHYSNNEANNNTNIINGADTTDKNDDVTMYEYRLAEIPAGYQELTTFEDQFGKSYVYVNNTGEILQFSYSYSTSDNAFVETQDYERYSAFVHESYADIYISQNDGETSVILWEDSHTGVLFQISAVAGSDQLIEIAKMVIKIE